MQLNVNIGGSHGGITVGADGATHQAIEEISLMRTIPHMTVIVPSDGFQAKKATIAAATFPGPVYFRLGRSNIPAISDEKTAYEIGKIIPLCEGSDVTMIACGIMVCSALEAAAVLKQEGISARVLDCHTIKPIDRKAIIDAAVQTGAIVTCEEHTVIGGLGSAVAEVVCQEYPVPVKFVGIPDVFGESGEPDELLNHFGLTNAHLVLACKEVLMRKKK